MIRKVILAAMLASSLGSVALPGFAGERGYRNGPPPPREEAVPQPRRGYVWTTGYWEQKNRKYHWVKGSWVRERRDYRYNESKWVERDGRWHLERGAWTRADRDGDGIPNRQDRAPDNPRRQ
ncbi:MAG: hypothetical protein JWO70_3533 [Betaproteobacteria bacterium]|jgi:hypothetical protein|nr:hypothetical protein [Betaproteobacteria bacterium]